MKCLTRALVIALFATSPLASHAAANVSLIDTQARADVVSVEDAPERTDVDARHADHRLERKVRQALYRGKVDVTHVSILARNGRVTLIGGVPAQAMIQAAATIATNVPGVRSVDSELIRRPEQN
jgi:hyperosmotically inducible periplasmic protein